MVGRFASDELKREALAHEDLYAGQGVLGRCSCLIGAFLLVVGFLTFLNLDGLVWGGRWPSRAPAMVPEEASSGVYVHDGSLSMGHGGADLGALPSLTQEEHANMGLDASLVTLCVTVVVLCLLAPCVRALSGPWQPWGGLAPAWGPLAGPEGLLGPGPGALGGGLFGDLSAGAARGRVVDVKPGELRSGQAGGFFGGFSGGLGGSLGWIQGAGALDWGGAPTAGAGGTGGGAWGGGGSWTSPVPSAYATAAPGLPGVPGSVGTWPALGGGALALGATGANHVAGLPTEAETMETYASFGVELQQWGPALAGVVDREVVEPLLRELDENDQLWAQVLNPRGWRLTHEAPRLTYPGIGPGAQELSVFDRNLPRPLCDDRQAVELWNRRQTLEVFLVHPSFEPAQRPYVLERLREWRHRGVLSAMRHEWRANPSLPTDGHILENLLVKMLSIYLDDFAGCFMGAGHSPPLAKHLGQSPTAYLRQVTDQSLFPKPAPHYDVVTLQRAWRIRPGNTNLLEALALLLQALRRNSRSYQSFPQLLRTAVESVAAPSAPARTFTSWF